MGKTYDPAEIQEEVIVPQCQKFLDNFDGFLRGTTDEFENIHQVVEESLWAVYDMGFNAARKGKKV